jgi:peptidase C25-like protein/flagellar hook capping protein FlgD
VRTYFVIVVLFLFTDSFAQKDYKILSSSNNFLVVEYTPQYLDQSEITLNNSEYKNIDLFSGVDASESAIGSPIIPRRVLNVGVQSEFGNSIKILSSDYKTISGKIKPKPNVRRINNFPSYEYLETENYSNYENPELVSFGEFGLVRDLKVQLINICPVQFDPVTQEIKLYSRIVFQINFAKTSNLNTITKSELTKGLVINSKIASNWGSEAKLSKKSIVKSSVLAIGDWYRFEAPEEGIYKIDRTFLTGLGIDIDDVDPRTIKIYNNGGKRLDSTPTASRPIDLVENAIIVEGEDDGSFDSSDLIFFYGRGVDFWEYNNIVDKITRNMHWYSKKNYYWLTYGGSNGSRMEVQSSEVGTPNLVQSTTKAYRFQDNDNQNLIGSGLLHVDDDYSSSSQSKTYAHMLDGLVAGSIINYTFQFVNGATSSNLLTIDENGSEIFSRSITGASTSNQEYRYGSLTRNTANYFNTLPDNRSVLKFTYNPSSISDKGHLDFIEIEYTQDLKTPLANLPIVFFSDEVDGLVKYEGTPFSNSNFKVYNLSDYANPKIIDVVHNGGGFSFTSNESVKFSSKYLAIHDEDVKAPKSGEKILNSNLRGFTSGVQYIIITPREFKEQAERLMNYRVNEAQLKTTGLITYIDEIYNEFSGGALDPIAIRDFLKYAYDNWEIQPEYVLLFGDGDYDYFNILGKNLNFIPTFQTTESLYEIGSYPYDDYYSRISGNDDLADIGIGRLCITSTHEAEIVVDKIINYETKLNKGLWRNRITLLADDASVSDGSESVMHIPQSESLSKTYIPDNFDRNKIYLPEFQTINTGLGRRKPDCNTAVIDAINNGTLIFNYVGHGNPDVWAHEIVFDRSISIPQLRNEELFFLTAATCDFGKYDDPNLQSATEEMILMENAGMIGGLSAARPVFSERNAGLNQEFYKHMFGERDSFGFPVPIGFAYMRLKQVFTDGKDGNDKKFHLFADPMLRLNIPKLPVEITSVNDAGLMDTVNVKALSEITIKGKVLNSNQTDSQLEGEGIITVFDSKRIIHLDDINYDMTDQGGVIFRGRVSVENGNFATSFTVPKDISYENKNGKIVAYFFNDEIDGVGYTNNVIIGGTDSTNTNDGIGPDIEILYDDESESSYLVSPNFKLRVKLNDATGLNTTGTGIGHKLEAIINEDEQNSIDLTNYFVGDLNSGGKSGEVNYNFSAMEPGEYKIKVNAWDVYNNFASQEDYFTVVDENDLVIREVYNYPNPFSANTYFTFQHNLTEALNVKVRVYTITGRVIKEIETFNIEDKFVKIEWNGKDDDNNKIGNGTYLYKLIVETVDGVYKENILGKMAVIR